MGYYGIPSGVCPSVRTLFPDNSYSFHPIVLKLGGQLDHEVIQCILFRDYSTPNKVISFLTIFQTFLFLDNLVFIGCVETWRTVRP